MNGAGAVFFEGLEMVWRSIPFVAVKAVPWIFLVIARHKPVAGDLRNDG